MKTKFNLDRKPLDSSFIQSRQDFDKVLKGYQALKPPLWKNPWFYGPVGLASLAVALTLTFQNNFFANGDNSTLSASIQNDDKQELEDTPCLQPLHEKTDIPFENFAVDPEKGGDFTTQNGTIIHVPKGSLTAEEDGPVNLKVREFPDMESAFLAGVPMDYGQKSAFESGGMIEIRGEQDGATVTIDPKKPLKVDMTLYNAGNDFKFWALNEENSQWSTYPCTFTTNSNLKPVKSTGNSKATLGAIQEVQQKIENCEKEIQTVQQKDTKEELVPTKNARKLVVEFEPKAFPELAAYKDIEFEYLLPKVQTSANMSEFQKRIEYASSQTWNDMDVAKKNGDYVIIFKNKRENYSVPVKPVLKGQSLAQLENQLKEAEGKKKEKLQELQAEKVALLKREKELKFKHEKAVNDLKAQLNSMVPASQTENAAARTNQDVATVASNFNSTRANFVTSGFGLFNCDRPIPYPEAFEQPVLCQNEDGERIQVISAYVFDQKRNTRFTYGERNGRGLHELAWTKNKGALIVIDGEGNLYYKTDLQDLSLDKFTVRLKKIDRKDVNLSEIQKIVSENSLTV